MAMHFQELPICTGSMYEAIDPEHMYNMAITGAYIQHLDTEEGSGDFRVYIPAGIQHSCRAVYIFAPSSADPETFLEITGWKAVADEEKCMLLLLMPDVCGSETFVRKIVEKAHDRKFYNIQAMFRHIAGYGDGAISALRLAAGYPMDFAGLFLSGELIGASALLAEVGERHSDADYIPLKDVPMPVWVWANEFGSEHQTIIDYYRRANRTEAEAYQKGDTLYYIPDWALTKDVVSQQPVARVLTTEGSCPVRTRQAGRIFREFFVKTLRAKGILNGDLHPYRTFEQWGAERRDMVVDGFRRQYLLYIPSYAKRNPDYKMPLVVYLHGGSNTGEANAYSHEWFHVAEARRFAVVCPSGAMRRFDNAIPHPAWNASRQENIQDDLKFIRELVDRTAAELPIDRSRVYVTGHSMGSAMTQQCALTMPDIFAAAASNSGIVGGNFLGSFELSGIREDLDIPVWIQMGQNDVGGGTFEDNPKARRTAEYWINRQRLTDADHPVTYVDGPYRTKVFTNEEQVPMLTYVTTDEKPHAVTAADAWIYYDQFFCRFSRAEDGSVVYMGKPVKKSH